MKINRPMLIVAIAVSVFFISGYYSVCQAGPPTGVKKEISKVNAIKNVQIKGSIKIISLKTTTAPERSKVSGGPWIWTAVVANTGLTKIKKGTLQFDASAVYPSGKKCVVSSVVLNRDIAPKTKATINGRWSNCSARKLTLTVQTLPLPRKSPLAVKITSVPKISAEIQNFTFVRDTKTWTAIIKNTSSVPLSFFTNGVGIRNGVSTGIAWEDTPVLSPGKTVTFTGRYVQWQPGTTIKYHVRNKCEYCLSGKVELLHLDTFEYTY